MPYVISTPAEIEEAHSLLIQTVPRIQATAESIDEQRLRWAPEKRVWSVVEHVAHVRGCADVWSATIYAMLAEEQPTLIRVDPRQWAKEKGYTKLPFATLFQPFVEERAKLLQHLQPLTIQEWQRSARIDNHLHSIFTQVRRMALHETQHCAQIEELLSRQQLKNRQHC